MAHRLHRAPVLAHRVRAHRTCTTALPGADPEDDPAVDDATREFLLAAVRVTGPVALGDLVSWLDTGR